MCKRGGLLVAYDLVAHRALMTDADCGSWKCEECAQRLRQHWTQRAAHGAKVLLDEGNTLYFATLTCHERNKTFEAGAASFPDAWGKLHKRLNRTSDTREYLLIPEHHKDGRLHMHAIWTFPVKTRWLKDNGRSCGFGYMNQIGRRGHLDEEIHDPATVSDYVSKELGKQLGYTVPPRFRRVRVSKHWAALPLPDTDTSELDWHYIGGNGALNAVYEECDHLKLTIIDVRTGEMFDDIDMGTIAWTP